MANGILLQSGAFYSYDKPEQNEFTIEDVALSLSHTCRYGGQVAQFYSVAQHAVLVSYAVKDKRYKLEALCHDNTEAFMCDIPTPLKLMLPCYKALEAKHEEAMFNRFGLEYPMPQCVHDADRAVLAAEVRDLKPENSHWDFLRDVKPYKGIVEPWDSDYAYEMFLWRFYKLLGKRVVH